MIEAHTRQHRIASYNKGCRCADCLAAKAEVGRRQRSNDRRRRGATFECLFCECVFFTRATRQQHETIIHG